MRTHSKERKFHIHELENCCWYRLAEVVANKLRLEEEEDQHRQGQDMTDQLSESAQAIRDASALQQMASQSDSTQDQVSQIQLG